jgi:pantetheine-phosphate adenylyltransferase
MGDGPALVQRWLDGIGVDTERLSAAEWSIRVPSAKRGVVAVAASRGKGPLFGVDQRLQMLRESIGENPAVSIVPLEGLLVDFARELGVFTVIRGLRAVSDFEFEFQMALMNRKLEPRLETVYLTPKEDYTYLSSRIVKEVGRFGGDLSQFVPPAAARMLLEKT